MNELMPLTKAKFAEKNRNPKAKLMNTLLEIEKRIYRGKVQFFIFIS
jgi:hypothetical protein